MKVEILRNYRGRFMEPSRDIGGNLSVSLESQRNKDVNGGFITAVALL